MSITVTLPMDAKPSETATAAEGVADPASKEETKSATAVEETEGQEPDDESDPSKEQGEDDDESEESEESEEKEEGDEELEAKAKNEEEEKTKKNGVQKRIDKLRAREAQAKQEAAYWREQALKGAKGPAEDVKPRVENAQNPTSKDEGPNPDDFQTFAEYDAARIKFEVDKRFKAIEDEKKAAEEKTKRETIQKNHDARVAEFMKAEPDYREVVEAAIDELGDYEFPVGFTSLIKESDNGPEIFFELAKDPSKLIEVSSMPYGQMCREIGRLEARLTKQERSAEPKQEIKKPKAPAPISPVGGRVTSPTKSIYDPNLSQKEWEAARERQIARREARG